MSQRDFKDYQEDDVAQEATSFKEPPLEEDFPEPDFEETVEETPLFTRETKIGLAVVLVLVIVLAAVLVKRFTHSAGPDEGKQATAKNESSKTESSSPNKTSSSPVPKPTVVEPRPGFSRQSSPSEAAPWVPSSFSSSAGSSSWEHGKMFPSERGPASSDRAFPGGLRSVQASQPVGSAWSSDQSSAASPPGQLPPSERFSSRSPEYPNIPSQDTNNPLRPLAPSEGAKSAVSSGNPGYSGGFGSQPSGNPSGAMAPSVDNRWGQYPTREGTSPAPSFPTPGPSSAGTFSSPPSGPSSAGSFSSPNQAISPSGGGNSPYAPPMYGSGSPGNTPGSVPQDALRTSPSGQPPLRNTPSPFSSPAGSSPPASPPGSASSSGAGVAGTSDSLKLMYGAPPPSNEIALSRTNTNSPALASPTPSSVGGNTPGAGSSGVRTYLVQPGESYWTIAEKFYGSGVYYQALAEYNRSRIPPEQLQVGAPLLIPSRDELERAYPHLCRTPSSPRTDGSSVSSGSPSGIAAPIPGSPSGRENFSYPQARIPSSSASQQVGSQSGRENPYSPSLLDRRPQESANRPLAPRVYIVQEGDNLYEIARHLLGTPTRWVEIYELNKEIIGQDLEHLQPGTRLAIPPVEPVTSSGPMSAVPLRPSVR